MRKQALVRETELPQKNMNYLRIREKMIMADVSKGHKAEKTQNSDERMKTIIIIILEDGGNANT